MIFHCVSSQFVRQLLLPIFTVSIGLYRNIPSQLLGPIQLQPLRKNLIRYPIKKKRKRLYKGRMIFCSITHTREDVTCIKTNCVRNGSRIVYKRLASSKHLFPSTFLSFRFSKNIYKTCGEKINVFFKMCWMVVIPIILLALCVRMTYLYASQVGYYTTWKQKEVLK